MKILFVADVFFPDTVGGAGRVAYHLARELGQRHDVHIVTRNPERTFTDCEQLDVGIHVHRFRVPPVTHPGFFFSEIWHSSDLYKKIWDDLPPDLVCAHQSLPALPLRLNPRFRGNLFVYCFHSPWHEEYISKKRRDTGMSPMLRRWMASLMKALEGYVVHSAQRIFVISPYMKKLIADTHGVSDRKVLPIPPGVDLDAFRLPETGKMSEKHRLGWPVDKLMFLTARNLVPRMGLENLIKAVAGSPVLCSKAMFMIVGDGPLRTRLTSLIRDFELESTILLMGRVPEDLLIQCYQAADFFVLPTRELEGFGLVIIESLACGTAVIGTPVGAIPDILKPFNPRCVCDGFQDHHIREKLEAVVAAPDAYRNSPEQCRQFVVKNFSWNGMARSFEEALIPLIHSA